MNNISASFNFHSDFFWGIVPPDIDDPENDIPGMLFRLQEMNVQAILIKVPWSKCEPLRGHFDEAYIESVRQKLIRIRNRNIKPVIIPDTGSAPAWLNLDHHAGEKRNSTNATDFIRHLAGATVSFTDHFGILCAADQPLLHTGATSFPHLFPEIREHIRSLAPDVKTGIVLYDGFPGRQKGISSLLTRMRFGFLKKSGLDFLGIPAQENSAERIRNVFGGLRIPTLFISDGLSGISETEETEELTDRIYEVWQMYQKGLPVIGYISETSPDPEKPASAVFTNVCKNNALQISTDMEGLSEKWIRFLKD